LVSSLFILVFLSLYLQFTGCTYNVKFIYKLFQKTFYRLALRFNNLRSLAASPPHMP
jgi:hypothetical protein